MSEIPLAKGYWADAVNRTDRVRLHNMIVGQNAANQIDGTMHRQRPGMVAHSTIGPGPINFMWRQDGTLGGEYLTVSGGLLYVGSTLLGYVGTTGISMAGSPDRVLIVAGGIAYRTDGVSLVAVNMPDDRPASSVRYINGFFLISVADTQLFYWILPGADDPDPLDFASAERMPDAIKSIAISGDTIWFLGAEGEEVWIGTADPDAPFQRVTGRVSNYGCADIGSVVEINTIIFWVTAAHQIAAGSGPPQIVSDDAIDGILAVDTAFKAWAFLMGGHTMYVVTTPTITLAYDIRAQIWSRFSSYERENWRGWVGARRETEVLAGDSESGQIWALDWNAWNDADEPLVREVSGSVANTGPPFGAASVSLGTSVGWSTSYTEQPVLELRWSDDQGATFSQPRALGLGFKGQYHTDAVVRSLGLIQRPGRTFVWRMTDDALWRVDYARLNEA
ncbi:hypothetical protein [Rhizorhabdus wittichii]|uniref:hypothetical protein n=1 Tax=Rhizorhabdus wittichii TaxID=160791 RepID=UPI0002E8F702|nr:hypothetical protein [Rhizorhabdus wittichii]